MSNFEYAGVGIARCSDRDAGVGIAKCIDRETFLKASLVLGQYGRHYRSFQRKQAS